MVLAGAQAGGQWALGWLYREFNPALVRYLEGRAPGAGDDLAQDVWIGASRGLARFSGTQSQFRSWLFTIAHRQVAGHWRRHARRPSVPVDPQELATLGAVTDPVEALSSRQAVAELTVGLSPDQADVVLLRVVAGLSVPEVAAIVGKKPGAVRVLQHRALQRMARAVDASAVTP